MNVDVCTSLPITTAMSRLDLRIGVSLPGPLRRAGLPRPEPDASGTGRGGASAALGVSWRACESLTGRRFPVLACGCVVPCWPAAVAARCTWTR